MIRTDTPSSAFADIGAMIAAANKNPFILQPMANPLVIGFQSRLNIADLNAFGQLSLAALHCYIRLEFPADDSRYQIRSGIGMAWQESARLAITKSEMPFVLFRHRIP